MFARFLCFFVLFFFGCLKMFTNEFESCHNAFLAAERRSMIDFLHVVTMSYKYIRFFILFSRLRHLLGLARCYWKCIKLVEVITSSHFMLSKFYVCYFMSMRSLKPILCSNLSTVEGERKSEKTFEARKRAPFPIIICSRDRENFHKFSLPPTHTQLFPSPWAVMVEFSE